MANEPGKLPAGSIQLETLTLTSDMTGETIDLRSIVQEFSIFEALDKPFLTGELVIKDALSLMTTFPIVGMETVEIEFKTPDPSVLKSVKTKMKVIRMENMKKESVAVRAVGYILKLASREYIDDLNTKIRKSYRDPISTMVNSICEEYLNTQKDLEIGDTDGQRVIVIPNMSPSRAIRFLAKEAMSTTYKPSNFIFYEDVDGFKFKTIESLIQDRGTGRTGRRTTDQYYAAERDVNPKSESSTTGGRGSRTNKPFELQKITDFSFVNIFSTDKMLRYGGYENRIEYVNPTISLFETKVYEYFNDAINLAHTTSGKAGKFIPQKNDILKGTGDAKVHFYVTNKDAQAEIPEQKHEFLQWMIASQALLNGVLLNITISGDTDRRVGDTIKIQFPEFGGTDDVLGKINKFISGEYLVSSVRHIYNGQGYHCVLQVAKNCYEQDPDDRI